MKNLTVILSILVLPILGQGQESSVPMELGVYDAVKYAWENSQKSKNAAIDVRQADKEVWVQASRGLPIVNGSFGFNNFLDLPTSIIPAEAFGAPPGSPNIEAQFGQPWTMEAGVNASLQIFDGTYIVGVKGARGFQKMSRDIEKMTRNEVKTMVGQAYYTSQIAKENVRLLNENIANMEKTLEETEALYKEGFSEEMDVEQLDLLINQIKNRALAAQRQHEATLNLLKYQIGMPIETKITLTDDLETLWGLQANEELMAMELDLNNNLQYDIMKQDVVMHGYKIGLEKAKYYPRLHAFFDYKQQAFRDEFSFFDFDEPWFPQTLWGVQLSVPIWDNLGGVARIKKAKLEQQRVQNRLEDTERALKMQAITAKDDFTSALEQLETSNENVALASRIKEKTLIRYQEGLATSMELTQAENQQIQAQTEYINTLFKAMDAKLQMKVVLENN